ncbi:hypothetical protein B0T10DRAFT_467328 [Thelonectria olida]|uniref:Uncharacterized protein n=1 Tax=Thelonectria olida TaxID=1576542 RepID=A0A9P9AEB5_9HYPO|nr:hypothetical protein B0T10DRAFT_467328 [Thelonectria olida]
MDPDLSEDLCRFREFSQRHGPATLAEELRPSRISSFSNEDVTSSLHEILNRGLNRLYREWLSTTTLSARSASPNSGRTQPTQHETPVGSLADSGVVLRSQELSHELGYGSSGSRSTDGIQQRDAPNEAQQGTTSLESIMTIAPIPDYNHQFDIDGSYRQTTRHEENLGEDGSYSASGHEAVVKLLLDTAQADVDARDTELLRSVVADQWPIPIY